MKPLDTLKRRTTFFSVYTIYLYYFFEIIVFIAVNKPVHIRPFCDSQPVLEFSILHFCYDFVSFLREIVSMYLGESV